MTSKASFCRICEPGCAIRVNFDERGDPVNITPDTNNPASGVACHKGLSFLDIHNDPDRMAWPLKRVNSRTEARGDFFRVSWDSAIEEIGDRLKAIREEHGPSAVGVYIGNPTAFNSTYQLFASDLIASLNTPFRFTSNTQDTSNKMATVAEVYGSPMSFMIPDLDHTDYLLCIGSNPKVSRWTLMSATNDWDIVKNIKRRGGKVRFVNPRITESSTIETGPTLQIRPGADVYFLAAVLHEVEALNHFDVDIVVKYGRNVEALRNFVRMYPPELVSNVVGLDAERIRAVARELLDARSAVVYMATGVNQSRQGMLSAWLVEMLQFMTGNLGRKGGTYKPNGLSLNCPAVTGVRRIETSIGPFEVLQPGLFVPLPANIMSSLIRNGDIKAMLVIGGNPLLSVAGETEAREAFKNLELLVSLDIYRNATGELADFVLPTVDFLERRDINLLSSSGMQQQPKVQYTDAMVAPGYERREDWWILCRLLQAAGLDSPLNGEPDLDWGREIIQKKLARRGLSIEKLRKAPSGTVLLEPLDYDALFEICLQHPDKKIDCFPKKFVSAGLFERFEYILEESLNEAPHTLKLISLRTPYMHNSWFTNVPRYRKGKERENPLHMSKSDVERLGFVEGDHVKVSTAFGSIEAHVFVDDSLREGTVAMTHGYGQQGTFALRVAQQNAGSNCNDIMPTGPDSIEPLSHMAWLSAVPVTVTKCHFD